MPLEAPKRLPKAQPPKRESSNSAYKVAREMPPREWLVSELIDLYFEIDGETGAHYNARKDILLKLLDIQGDEDDETQQLFIPDIDDIDEINEQLSIIQVDSLISKAIKDDARD